MKYEGKKVKVKLSLSHDMKTLGSGGIAPRIPDLSTRRRRVVSFTSQPLYPQVKSPLVPI
jgi:hypothetical protein